MKKKPLTDVCARVITIALAEIAIGPLSIFTADAQVQSGTDAERDSGGGDQ